jgi:hypothetical protein
VEVLSEIEANVDFSYVKRDRERLLQPIKAQGEVPTKVKEGREGKGMKEGKEAKWGKGKAARPSSGQPHKQRGAAVH